MSIHAETFLREQLQGRHSNTRDQLLKNIYGVSLPSTKNLRSASNKASEVLELVNMA